MEYRRRILPWVLVTLGALLALWAFVMLRQVPNVLQYAILAPEAGEENATINESLNKAQEAIEGKRASFKAMTLDGSLTTNVKASEERPFFDVNLVCIGEGWLDVYHRVLRQGRRISELELQQGTAVIMLDDDLAVAMFGSELPESTTVLLNNVEFRVVGTVKHGGSVFGGRGVGDALRYDAYIPLKAAVANGLTMQTMKMSAVPRSGLGWSNTFLAGAQQWSENGQLIDLRKEAMRRTVLPRLLLLIVGLYALYGLFIRATDLVMGWFEGYRLALKQRYFKELIPRLAGIVALTLACYAALVGAAWLLLSFSVQPVYTFTEWVPENFVEWTSIAKVFWNLVTASAGLVRIGTRELRIIEFWGAALRWGVILVLFGVALLPKARRRKQG